LGRRVAPRMAARELPAAVALSPDRLAIEVVRHLNGGDLDGFRRVVAPTVRLSAANGSTTLSAAELFTRLSTLVPGQTLCAAQVDTGIGEPLGVDHRAGADQRHGAAQVASLVDGNRGHNPSFAQLEGGEPPLLEAASHHEAVPGLGEPRVLDVAVVLVRPEPG